jgi:hypothetical protein
MEVKIRLMETETSLIGKKIPLLGKFLHDELSSLLFLRQPRPFR